MLFDLRQFKIVFIDNKKYISNNMYLQKCNNYCFDEEDAIKLAKKIIKDRKLQCFINPNNHEESIVITDVAKGSYLICFLMVYFISFIALMAEVY